MPQIRSPRRRRASILAVLASLVPCTVARADTASCHRLRGELAALNGSASTQRAVQSEIGRLETYYRTLNCGGGRFLFFDARPPQCGAVEQRIKALNSGYGAENGEVVAARRRQLTAAVGAACANAVPNEDARSVQQTARGGGRVICVKTCDGSFFPMNNLPDGRGGADELCQALCPGTEAIAYSMPHGDDALRQAATIKGNKAYTVLPSAFRFRSNFAPGCSCKRDGQTWVKSLAKAESMLVRHKGDVFVTPMQAEALSRPKVRLTLVGRADRTAAELAADVAARSHASDVRAWSDPPAPSPSQARERPGAQTVATAEDRAGIRVIAPSMIPVPARVLTP